MRNVVFLLCFIPLACVSAPSQTPKEVRSVIERDNANAAKWYASGDVDSLALLFAEDAWQMPQNSPPLVGREAIRQFWAQAMKFGKWNFSLQTQTVSVSGPIAIERGKYVLKFGAGTGAPPGMNSFVDHGNYLVYWRKGSDGEWRVIADAPVSEVPMAPSPPQAH